MDALNSAIAPLGLSSFADEKRFIATAYCLLLIACVPVFQRMGVLGVERVDFHRDDAEIDE